MVSQIEIPQKRILAHSRKNEARCAAQSRDTGLQRVVTSLSILGLDDETKRMRLLSLNPGVQCH
jgi:hypothetical protein